MFKAILLGQWHSLSDAKPEEALNVGLDFMKFCEFELHETAPDYSSLNRFRNKLIQRKLDEKLSNEINRQLEILDLKVQKAQAAIIDATIELLNNPFLSVIFLYHKFACTPQIHQAFC